MATWGRTARARRRRSVCSSGWQLFGSLLGAPKLLVELTPFAHVGLVPGQPFRIGSAAVMLLIGAVAQLAAIHSFERRDLLAA